MEVLSIADYFVPYTEVQFIELSSKVCLCKTCFEHQHQKRPAARKMRISDVFGTLLISTIPSDDLAIILQ